MLTKYINLYRLCLDSAFVIEQMLELVTVSALVPGKKITLLCINV